VGTGIGERMTWRCRSASGVLPRRSVILRAREKEGDGAARHPAPTVGDTSAATPTLRRHEQACKDSKRGDQAGHGDDELPELRELRGRHTRVSATSSRA
jgi:hypothetical protein